MWGLRLMSWSMGIVLGISTAVLIPNVIGIILGVAAMLWTVRKVKKMSTIEIEVEIEDEYYI